MKKILLLIASLVISSQVVCAQVSEVEKKKLEEQVVLAIKKYEGLGLSTEQLAEKVAADLLVQAQALQDDTALGEEKSNFNKKLIIGAVVAVAVCGIGYYVYTTYFGRTPIEKAFAELAKARGKEISEEDLKPLRKMAEKEPELAQDIADRISKLASKAAGKSDAELKKEFMGEFVGAVKSSLAKKGIDVDAAGIDIEDMLDKQFGGMGGF